MHKICLEYQGRVNEGTLLLKLLDLIREMNGISSAQDFKKEVYSNRNRLIKDFDITMKVPIGYNRSVCISFNFDVPKCN